MEVPYPGKYIAQYQFYTTNAYFTDIVADVGYLDAIGMFSILSILMD